MKLNRFKERFAYKKNLDCENKKLMEEMNKIGQKRRGLKKDICS
jgi:hypothetical protein